MKNKLAKVSSVVTTGVIALSGFVRSTFAIEAAPDPFSWIDPITTTGDDLQSWIIGLINWAIGLAALAAVIMLIAAGFLYITANGDENKVGKATKTLTFAIIGLVVCFIAVMLVQFVLKNFLQQ